MRTKTIMSFTVRPDVKTSIKRAAKADGHDVSPLIEALIENYLEVRNEKLNSQTLSGTDPLSLRAL
jgi:hypothetical protein